MAVPFMRYVPELQLNLITRRNHLIPKVDPVNISVIVDVVRSTVRIRGWIVVTNPQRMISPALMSLPADYLFSLCVVQSHRCYLPRFQLLHTALQSKENSSEPSTCNLLST